MPRYRMTLEYDGGPFVGWQRQDNGLGVQQVVEEAIERFCGEAVRIIAAGRTDAGVHATGQIVHADLARETSGRTLRDALNFHMKPHPVCVLEAEAVSADIHARFSARERAYRYRILNRRPPPVLDRQRVWWVAAPLDAEAMAAAAQVLVGRHDFTSFRASICQAKSPVRTLDLLAVQRVGDEIHVRAKARSFLHHQVRNMVGTLERVGAGAWTVDDVARALAARNRAAGGPTAPAAGLYLESVGYPEPTP
jgi:tRNA pseudouridine38-40 synthase